MSTVNLDGIPDDELTRYLDFRGSVADTNISSDTLLATDYLNHFNEIVMLLEMVPDMPEILDEVRAWQPKGYCDHFRDSSFSDRDLAIAAYDHVPTKFRQPFEETIEQINRLILQSITAADGTGAADGSSGGPVSDEDAELARIKAQGCVRAVQKLMEVASAIIHGSSVTMQQEEIDLLLG